MLSKSRWLLNLMWRQIWVRAALIGSLAILAALVGTVAGPLIPERWGSLVGADSVDQILNILASSMLAVVTFSLSVAVQAFASATSNATPRANALLAQDNTTQFVLSIFLGAFLFGLVGIIALSVEVYGGGGRLILFVATLAVIVLVVGALIHWIQHLMRFGRMEDILERVEEAATDALKARARAPWLGGSPYRDDFADDACSVLPRKIGYIQFIDVEDLAKCADEWDRDIRIHRHPGGFAHPAEPLLWVSPGPPLDETCIERLRDAFAIGQARTFDQDPRFGLIVLSEIAVRALSPAVNDPGTAIDVIGRLVRVMHGWATTEEDKGRHPRIQIPGIDPADMLDDAFRPIARDGAGMFEVQIRIQKALSALAALAPETLAEPARLLSQATLKAARTNLDEESERCDLLSAASIRVG